MRVAAIQLAVTDGHTKRDRLSRVKSILSTLGREEAPPELVLLPELWGAGFFTFDNYARDSEPAEGETYVELSPWAERLGCYLLAGSIVERDGERLYNTALLVDPRGRLIAKYRKMHLFGYQSEEAKILSPGDSVCVVGTEHGVWGITTCYDLRFPELYRVMVERGAQVFLVVSAWPLSRLNHWLLFNQTRALENQTYLVSCNCAGTLAGTAFAGHSMVVDPQGVAIARGGEGEAVVWGDVLLEKVKESRALFPALHDRRILLDSEVASVPTPPGT